MTKQATTTVQCNGMQCSPAQRAFSQMCDDLHASCQVKYLTNPTCFFGYGYNSKPDKLQTHLDRPFFLLYPYCPNATQTSPNECHPNIPITNATQTSPQNECHPNIPITNATQTSSNECHPNISSLDAWPLLYNSFATMMTKVERGSTHKRIPLYNGFFS